MKQFPLLFLVFASSGCSIVAGLDEFYVVQDGGPDSPRDAGADGGLDAMPPPPDACVLRTYFRDADEDDFGDPETTMEACSLPEGHVENSDDCDDGDDGVAPGAEETCDGADNDCDGAFDEGLLGAVGEAVELDADSGGGVMALVATPSGSFAAWSSSDSRLWTAFVSSDHTAEPVLMPQLAVAGGQSSPFAILFESDLGPPQIVLAWREDSEILVQVLPADGSAFPVSERIVTSGYFMEGSPFNVLAVVGDRAALTWVEDPMDGTMGSVLIDPFAGRLDGPAEVIDLDPANELDFSFLLGWAGQDDPATLVGTRIISDPTTRHDLVVFDVTESEIVWRGESSNLTSDPVLGSYQGGVLHQPDRGATKIPGSFAWSTESMTCFGSLDTPAAGRPVPDPSCISAAFDFETVAIEDGLATMILRRAGEFFDLFQQPLGEGLAGTSVTPVAQQTGGEGGPPLLSMYDDHGATMFVEMTGTGENRLMLQRIGCQ